MCDGWEGKSVRHHVEGAQADAARAQETADEKAEKLGEMEDQCREQAAQIAALHAWISHISAAVLFLLSQKEERP